MITETLPIEIVETLKGKLDHPCCIWSHLGQVIIEIENDEFEKYMGRLLQQIQITFDQCFADRDEDICLIIINKDRGIETVMKIWKPI